MQPNNNRYSRQLPVIGKDGQEKLTHARVLIVGLGGLGSPVALYLASAGVGTIGLVDGDRVEETNLHRQVIYSVHDVGKQKVRSAKETLQKQNPDITVHAITAHLTAENAEEIIREYDIVVDGTDLLDTKFLLNEVCRRLGKPLVYGAAIGMEGQLAVFTKDSACLACFVKQTTGPSCSTDGVLATTPGTIGLLQAAEVIKLVVGREPLEGLLIFDATKTAMRTYPIKKNPHCSVCGAGRDLNKKLQSPSMDDGREITPRDLKLLMDRKANIMVVDVREKWEREICAIIPSDLIPLGSLDKKLDDLDRNKLVFFYCHTGVRSLYAAEMAATRGLKTKSLAGGIAAWAEQIEPEMARY